MFFYLNCIGAFYLLPTGLDSDGAYIYFYFNTVGALIDSLRGVLKTQIASIGY